MFSKGIMELLCLLVLSVAAAATLSAEDSDPFAGYKLMSVVAKSQKQAEILQKLEREYKELDFWTGPYQNRTSTVLLPPHLLAPIEEILTAAGITWKEREANVAKIIEDGMRIPPVHSPGERRVRSTVQNVVDHTRYHSYGEMVSYLEEFEKKYPNNVELSYLTFPTHNGHQVAMIKLHGAPISSNKPSIIMESGIHAREWISPAATFYAIEKMLQNYQAGDSNAVSMLDWFDWYIVPETNPDGYEYTRTGKRQRLWRKNRRAISWYCRGVDLNRNFDVYFGTTGVSDDCDSLIYPGKNAFSEPETANIRELFKSVNNTIIAYLSVHSYSQFVLVPWSFSNVGLMPDNHEELNEIASEMAASIKSTHGKIYQVGTAWDLLNYAASGSSQDWAIYTNPNIYTVTYYELRPASNQQFSPKDAASGSSQDWAIYTKPNVFTVTYELRPDSNDDRGFNLPPNQIIPTGEEFLASLQTLAMKISKRK